jgi:vacuolar-type H+-ATPase subunit H
MKISTAKQGIICALVMAVTAPDEKSSKAVFKKAETQIQYLSNHYGDKLMKECQKKAEKILQGSEEEFEKYFKNFTTNAESNPIKYLV